MQKRLILPSILKFSKVFLEVSKVPSRTRGGGVVKIFGDGKAFFFYWCAYFCLVLCWLCVLLNCLPEALYATGRRYLLPTLPWIPLDHRSSLFMALTRCYMERIDFPAPCVWYNWLYFFFHGFIEMLLNHLKFIQLVVFWTSVSTQCKMGITNITPGQLYSLVNCSFSFLIQNTYALSSDRTLRTRVRIAFLICSGSSGQADIICSNSGCFCNKMAE